MTPEIHEKYNALQCAVELMRPAIEMWEHARGDFESDVTKFLGPMDAILPHFMSIQDMRTSQDNLKKALRVSKLLGQLRKELIIEKEEA